jgi:hypothetical protein
MSGSGLRLCGGPVVTLWLVSPLLLALLVAQATVYTWTDKAGVEHFTDDLTSVPRGVKVRTTEGDEISRIDSDLSHNPRPAAPVAPSVAAVRPEVPSVSEQTWRQLFKDARTRVAVLEEDIEADRKSVEEVNGLPVTARFTCSTGFYGYPVVSTGTTVSVGGQPFPRLGVNATVTGTNIVVGQTPQFAAPCFYGFNPEYERVRERLGKNRRELVRAREDLADLERRASFEAVPLHWRR